MFGGSAVAGAEECACAPAVAGAAFGPKEVRPSGPPIVVKPGSATLFRTSPTVNNVMISDDTVADVHVLDGLVYVRGKKPGKTVLYVVNDGGQVLLNRVVEVPSDMIRIMRGTKTEIWTPLPQSLESSAPDQPVEPASPTQSAQTTPPARS
jgi:hypothetical protein